MTAPITHESHGLHECVVCCYSVRRLRGRGLCTGCWREARNAGRLDDFVCGGRGRPPSRRDEVLADWDMLRGTVPFDDFAPRVGMTYAAWRRMFQRARAAGDGRAVKAAVSGRVAA